MVRYLLFRGNSMEVVEVKGKSLRIKSLQRIDKAMRSDGVSASSTTSAYRGSVDYSKGVSVLYDGREGFWVQAGAADQGSIDFFFGHQGLDVFRLYRAAVQDAEITGKFIAEGLRSLASNQEVCGGSKFGRGCLPGAYGPHGFISHHQSSCLLG